MMFEMGTALDLGREALLTTMLIAAPILAAGILVGLTVSIFQTITQLQDQTLSIVPKIAAMLLSATLLIPWLGERLVQYSRSMFGGP